jgi:hypothetical protein
MRMAARRRLAGLLLRLLAGTVVAQAQPATLFVVNFETGPSWDKARAPSEQPGFREHSANLNR